MGVRGIVYNSILFAESVFVFLVSSFVLFVKSMIVQKGSQRTRREYTNNQEKYFTRDYGRSNLKREQLNSFVFSFKIDNPEAFALPLFEVNSIDEVF